MFVWKVFCPNRYEATPGLLFVSGFKFVEIEE